MGATFAYFAVTVDNQSYSQTNVTGRTGKIPTITLTNEAKQLYLKVSAPEMAQEKENTKYYAVDSCDSDTSCNSPETEKDHNIVKVAVTDGDTDTTYACTGTVTITASGDLYNAEELKNGDVTLTLKNLNGDSGSDTIDLNTLKASSGTTTRQIKFDITGNNSQVVTASLYLENTEQDQSKLAGKDLNLTISATGVSCPVKQAGA